MSILVNVDPRSEGAQKLIKLSDELMFNLYPKEICFLDTAEDLEQHRAFVLGVEEHGDLVAIGAAKVMTGYGELKRVFTLPECRGRGYARWIISTLEDYLQPLVSVAYLETGTLQPQSIRLYRSMNYRERGPFGEYLENGYSVFMEKHL